MVTLLSVRVGCDFQFTALGPTHAVFQIEPIRTDRAAVLNEWWSISPELRRQGYEDSFGNICQRVTMPAGPFALRYDALVQVPGDEEDGDPSVRECAPADIPGPVLVYTLPSRYCLSDELQAVAATNFGAMTPGWSRVQAICDFVHSHLTFGYGSSSPLTTAVDVYNQKMGVCRDYTHLGIALCRAINIPARYVMGYMADIDNPPEGEMDFCAWMEVWLNGGWFTFDPRNNRKRIGRIVIARGRDALDCAMVTSFGSPILDSMTVWADQVFPEPAAASPT